MLVESVMSTDLATCDSGASLRSVAERMFDRRVGSVVITQEEDPVGIITETDLIRASYRTGRSLSEIQAAGTMSRPLVTIAEDRTLRSATEQMESEGIKKLVVVRDIDVVGIVTLTDIVHHFSDIKREMSEIEQRAYDEFNS